MSFTGTTDKCKACDKTVYVMDLMTLEGMPYHKSCFRCSHCNGTLVISNYSSMDGVLYCRPHFEQLFKESGNFSKNFQAGKTEKPNDLNRTPSKLSSFFSGTQDKCASCQKTVYPLEKVTMEGECYHKTCFKCAHSGCPLTHSSFASLNGVLYCKVHFNQLFLEKGSYNHVHQAAANHRRSASSGASSPPAIDLEPAEIAAVTEKEEETAPEEVAAPEEAEPEEAAAPEEAAPEEAAPEEAAPEEAAPEEAATEAAATEEAATEEPAPEEAAPEAAATKEAAPETAATEEAAPEEEGEKPEPVAAVS